MEEDMKKVECIIRPFKLEEVRDSLTEAGVRGITVSEVRGFWRSHRHTELYRGSEYTIEFVPKIKLEIIVGEDGVELVMEALLRIAATGKNGDGKIFIFPVDQAFRIRIGEKGSDVI